MAEFFHFYGIEKNHISACCSQGSKANHLVAGQSPWLLSRLDCCRLWRAAMIYWRAWICMCTHTTDYRCKVGRLLVSASCVTISNTNLLFTSETRLNLGIRRWKKHWSNWPQCQKAIGEVYFTKKWKGDTLQPGLEVDNFIPWLKSRFFKCISWLSGS